MVYIFCPESTTQTIFIQWSRIFVLEVPLSISAFFLSIKNKEGHGACIIIVLLFAAHCLFDMASLLILVLFIYLNLKVYFSDAKSMLSWSMPSHENSAYSNFFYFLFIKRNIDQVTFQTYIYALYASLMALYTGKGVFCWLCMSLHLFQM